MCVRKRQSGWSVTVHKININNFDIYYGGRKCVICAINCQDTMLENLCCVLKMFILSPE